MSSIPITPSVANAISTGVDKVKNVWNKVTNPSPEVRTELKKYDFVRDMRNALEAHPNQAKDDENTAQRQKSLADLQPHGFAADKKNADAVAAQHGRIVDAKTPALKMQAVVGKLNRVYASPQYQSLRPENRVKIKGLLYDRYVAPVMRLNGLEPPPKEEWLAGVNTKAYNEANKQPKGTVLGAAGSGFLSGTSSVAKLVGNVIHGVASYVTTDKGKSTETYKSLNRATDKVLRFADSVGNISTDYSSTFDTGHTAGSWTANFAGRMIGEAPAYMLAGEILGPAYKGTEAAAKTIIPSLAEKGAISTGFNFVKHGLEAAGDVFSVDKAEGKTTQESKTDAIGAAILGPALHASTMGLGKAFGIGRDSLVATMRFKANQLAAGGKPFVEKISQEADKIMGEESPKGVPTALVNDKDPDIKQAAMNEAHLREHIARQFHPEKADAAGSKSVWRILSKKQRSLVIEHIKTISDSTAEMMPLVAPEVQTQANGVELANQAKADPKFAARLQAVQKLTGLNPAEVITRAQATKVAAEAKLTSPGRILAEASEGEEEEYEPQEGAHASLSPGYSISHLKRNDSLITPKLSSPGISAEDFINGTIKYLGDSPATKSGKIYYEHPAHHLLAIATDSDAPPTVKAKAFKFMESEYGESKAEATKHGQWLKNHVDELRDSGKLKTEGNVYRSTKLTQGRYRTKWQGQLSLRDIPKSDMAFVKKLISQKPELKPVFSKMFKQLAALKQTAATPATEAARRGITKRIAETLEEYK